MKKIWKLSFLFLQHKKDKQTENQWLFSDLSENHATRQTSTLKSRKTGEHREPQPRPIYLEEKSHSHKQVGTHRDESDELLEAEYGHQESEKLKVWVRVEAQFERFYLQELY